MTCQAIANYLRVSVLAHLYPAAARCLQPGGAGHGRHYHRNCADADLCAGNQHGREHQSLVRLSA